MTEMTEIYIPPKYNQYGNRQVWFFETGNRSVDEVANGALLGVAVVATISLIP
jgi:hypothetical protein